MKLTPKQLSQCQFGAYCAIAAGLFYSILTIFAFLLPSSIATYMATEQYFADFKDIKLMFLSLKTFHICANLAMIGVVSAFLTLCRDNNYGIVSWCTIIAIIGYSIGIFQNIQDISIIPHLATQYEQGSIAIQQTILSLGVSNPVLFIMSLGLPGIWFIAVSLIALNNKSIPKLLVILGLLWGVGNILTAIAHAFIILELIYLVAAGAFIFAPLWGFMEGFYLLTIYHKYK
tara:strand:- start:72 stop:764 length:693 start_codon:yes stop_codon:yes gene_type:complete